jgi:hypothetical protein
MSGTTPTPQQPLDQQVPSDSAATASPGDEARFQPPFPPSVVETPPNATSPGTTDSTAGQPPHPRIEEALNATAAHVLPEYPIPRGEDHGGVKDVSKEGIGRDNEVHPHTPQPGEGKREEEKDPQQRPIIVGTPLDELRTPMFERGATSLYPAQADDKPPTVTEESLDPFAQSPPSTPSTPQPQAAGRAGTRPDNEVGRRLDRPGFGSGKEIGSVSFHIFGLCDVYNSLSPFLDAASTDAEASVASGLDT